MDNSIFLSQAYNLSMMRQEVAIMKRLHETHIGPPNEWDFRGRAAMAGGPFRSSIDCGYPLTRRSRRKHERHMRLMVGWGSLAGLLVSVASGAISTQGPTFLIKAIGGGRYPVEISNQNRDVPVTPHVSKSQRINVHLRLPPVVSVLKESPAYRRTFHALLAHPEITDRYDDEILAYSNLHHLDARLVKAIVAAESQFWPGALSPKGARGLMQVMPKTARDLGMAPGQLYGAEDNVMAGTAYLDELYRAAWRAYGLRDLPYEAAPYALRQRIVASYYAGPKALKRNFFSELASRKVHGRRLSLRRWRYRREMGRRITAYVRKVMLFYHSPATDFRRPAAPSRDYPSIAWARMLPFPY